MRFIAFVACLNLMACPSSEPVGGSDSGSVVGDSGVTATDSGPIANDDAGAVVGEPDAGAGQGASCVEAMECVLACDPTSRSCPQQCLTNVDPSQRTEAEAVFRCAQRNECTGFECLRENCPNEARACGEAGGVVGEPDAGAVVGEPDAGAGQGVSCVEAMECVLACDPTSRSCPQQCLTNVDPSQRTEAEAVFRCAQRNECTGFQCLMQNCQNEAQACGEAGGGGPGPGGADGGMGPPPEGNLTCAEFLTCADACGPRDQNCLGTCSDGVRRESNQLRNALIQCMMRNQCMDLDCGRRSCPDEAAACMRDAR